MQLDSNLINQIKDSLKISDIISNYIAIIPSGLNKFKACCPFHTEKTPSFHMNDDSNLYYCFGCHIGGDMVHFIEKMNNIKFNEAIEILAKKANITLPEISQDIKASKKFEYLYQIMDLANNFYQKQLFLSANKIAYDYLKNRGLNDEIIKIFNIGYAPDGWSSLKQYLATQNIKEEKMLELGLIKKKENKSYDTFRNRIIFPIFDISNHTIAFGGRAIESKQEPKYLNSPETPIFKKKQILYGLNFVKSFIKKQSQILVTEGYMDVIGLYIYGIKNSVAPLGTAFSLEHLQKLWRYAKTPIFCFDSDSAGIKAMYRVANLVLKNLDINYSAQFIKLPSGLDPDEFVKQYGKDAMQQQIAEATPLSEIIWQYEFEHMIVKTPEQLATFEHNIFTLCSKIPNQNIAKHYRSFFSKKIYELKTQLFFSQKNSKKNNYSQSKNIPDIPKSTLLSKYNSQELKLLAHIIFFSEILMNNEFFILFSELNFNDQKLRKIQQAIIEYIYNKFYKYKNNLNISEQNKTEKSKNNNDIHNQELREIIKKYPDEYLILINNYQYLELIKKNDLDINKLFKKLLIEHEISLMRQEQSKLQFEINKITLNVANNEIYLNTQNNIQQIEKEISNLETEIVELNDD